jgi:hypothetical protein
MGHYFDYCLDRARDDGEALKWSRGTDGGCLVYVEGRPCDWKPDRTLDQAAFTCAQRVWPPLEDQPEP